MTPVTEGAPSSDAAVRAPAVELNLLLCLVVAALAGGGLFFTARSGALVLLVAVAVIQAAFAFGWALGTAMPGRRGAIVVAALAASGADVAASVWPHGRLGTLVAVLGLALPVMFVHQLARGAARVQLVSSLSAVALLVLGEVSIVALLQLRHEFTDSTLGGRVAAAVAGAAAAALIVGYLVDMVLPAPRFDPEVPRGVLALVASAAVGAAIGYLTLGDQYAFANGRAIFVGAAVGALAGLLAVASAFIEHTTPEPASSSRRLLRPVFAALLPLCVLAPAAFLLCLAIRA